MIDKVSTQQVLGGLMKVPSRLGEVDKYSLDISDFSTSFEKLIFVSINNLYRNGAKVINVIELTNCIENEPKSKAIFTNNNGIEYLQDIEDFVEIDNFDYYYNKLKKVNLINDLNKLGFKTDKIYCDDLTKKEAFEINQRFDYLSTTDIIDIVKKELLLIEKNYVTNDVTETQTAAKGMEELIASFGGDDNIGFPLQGDYCNAVTTGARKGAFYLRSGSSGVSKTRQAVGDACYLAYPIRYDQVKCKWVKSGNNKKVLFIATEQNFDEIRKMILAYLTGINEDRFKYGQFSEREEKVIKQAIQVMNEYEDNFLIVRMPNPTIELVKTLVRENVLINKVEYVFYDYIFVGPSLLNEFKGFNLRNDEVLLMFATALKDLAVELNVFVMSSTQVNANADAATGIKNESSLAGGRSTINKADVGLIMSRPSADDIASIQDYLTQQGLETPNIMTDVYKVRSGAWSQVRIWSYVDLGILRKKDVVMTDSQGNVIHDVGVAEIYQNPNWNETHDVFEFMKGLNND